MKVIVTCLAKSLSAGLAFLDTDVAATSIYQTVGLIDPAQRITQPWSDTGMANMAH